MINDFQKIINACELNKNQQFTAGDLSLAKYHLQIALWLASLGYYVFFTGRNKKPFYKWREHSTRDPKVILEFWQRYPHGMVAIDCGKSEILVIDVDSKKEKQGLKAFKNCLQEWGDLPKETPIIISPTGGLHAYVKTPERELKRDIEGCIDLQRSGMCIIAPLSLNEESGLYKIHNPMLSQPELPILPSSWITNLTNDQPKSERTIYSSRTPKTTFQKKVHKQDVERLYEKCDYYAFCTDNSEDLDYSSWFWFAAMLSGFENGNEVFHKHSEKHPKYSFEECEQLFQDSKKYQCKCKGMRKRFEICSKCTKYKG